MTKRGRVCRSRPASRTPAASSARSRPPSRSSACTMVLPMLVAKSGLNKRRDADLFDTRRVDGPRCTSRRSARDASTMSSPTNAAATSRATDSALKHETSFQGSDGYLFFGNRALTARALATIIMDGAEPVPEKDPFYADNNLSLDFLLRLKRLSAASVRTSRLPRCARRVRAEPAVQDRLACREAAERCTPRPPTAAIPPACAPSQTTRSCSSSATSRTWLPALAPLSDQSAIAS